MPSQKSNEPAIPEHPQWFAMLLSRMALEATAEDSAFISPMLTSMQKILQADDVDEMWDADELDQTGGRDITDVEQKLMEYQVKYSTGGSDDIVTPFMDSHGRKMYLLIRSTRLDNGEEFVWNTSAPLLVGKILWLADKGLLPAEVVIRATELGGGRKVLKLKPIPQRAYQQAEAPF